MRDVIVALIVAGCGVANPPVMSSEDLARPAQPARHRPPPPPPPVPAIDGGGRGVELPRPFDEVVVVDAGREPRRELRYAPATGSTETVDVMIDRTMAPRTRATLQVEIVSANRHWIAYRIRVVAAYPEPRGGDPSPTWSPYDLVGAQIAGVVDSRGVPGETRFFGSSSAKQLFDGLAFEVPPVIPLPGVAVGDGARWQRVQRMCCYGGDPSHGGVTATTTYTLDGETIAARIEHAATAGGTIAVTSASGSLHATVDRERLVSTQRETYDVVLERRRAFEIHHVEEIDAK